MMHYQFSIGDLAREFDVTPRTLRFYEEKGLLNPDREGQNRVYGASDRTRLRLILRGKRLGLTLDESASLILMYDPASNNQHQLKALIEKIRESRVRLEEQLKDLQRMLSDVSEWEQRSMQELDALRMHKQTNQREK